MRSIWKGSIAFGLVNVPVKVYTATKGDEIRFHQVHTEDGGRIRYDRVCTVCGKSVAYADIDKAYESPEGDKVILTDEDFAKLPVAEKHEIPVLQFVPSEEIDPILFDRSYYLEPDSTTPKAYVLLAKTLDQVDQVALVHFTLRQKTRLAALRVRDGVLVLQTLLWPDEVRAAEFESLDDATPPRSQEVAMAQTLVDSMSEDFDPRQFTDDYQIELKKILDTAIESGSDRVTRHEEAEPEQQDAEVVDLVAALQRSLEATGRGASGTAGRRAEPKAAKSASKATKSTGRRSSKTTAEAKSGAAQSTTNKASPKATKQTRKGA